MEISCNRKSEDGRIFCAQEIICILSYFLIIFLWLHLNRHGPLAMSDSS